MRKDHLLVVFVFCSGLLLPLAYQTLGMPITAALCLSIFSFALWRIFFRRLTPVPVRLTMAITAIYGLSPLVDIAFLENLSGLDEVLYFEKMIPILILYCIGMFVLGAIFGRPVASESNNVAVRFDGGFLALSRSLRFSAIALVILALLSLGVATSSYGVAVGEFTRAEVYQKNNLPLHVLNYGIAIGVIFIASVAPPIRPAFIARMPFVALSWVSAILIMAYVNLGLLGDRRVFLSMLLAVAAYQPRRRFATNVGFLILFVFLWVYSFVRNTPYAAWLDILKGLDWRLVFNPANGEFGVWARIAQDILPLSYAEYYRSTFLSAPFSVIPSAIYPERPIGSALWYVRTYDPATAAMGGGWAFCLPLEGYLNFSFFGPLILGMIVGAVISRLAWSRDHGMIVAFIFAFSFRADLVSILQGLGWSYVFYLFYRTTLVGRLRSR